jgi:hypothetical protein
MHRRRDRVRIARLAELLGPGLLPGAERYGPGAAHLC